MQRAALLPTLFMACCLFAGPGMSGRLRAELLWYSRFETDGGADVLHDGVAQVIDNLAGDAGIPSPDVELSYVAYADGIPPLPPNLGGAVVAGEHALFFENDRAAAIRTLMPSDTGNLWDALTFEGYFHTYEADEILAPCCVGRRLVTQKRSDQDSQSRMAIGLHDDGLNGNVLAVYWNDGANQLGLGQTLIEPDRWYHFALVYDGDLRWYLDGELEGEVDDPGVVDPGAASIGIGNNRTGILTGTRGFYGLLDEIRIWDEALSPEQFLIHSALPGDFNGNGVLDLADIDDLTQQSAGQAHPAKYDLTEDALVDERDIQYWVRDLFGTWIGDGNLDGEFNSGDLVFVLTAGTYETGVPSVWSSGDFNGDGSTGSSDLVAALADGGYELGSRTALAVPEPGTIWPLAVSVLAWRGCRRRRWSRGIMRRRCDDAD